MSRRAGVVEVVRWVLGIANESVPGSIEIPQLWSLSVNVQHIQGCKLKRGYTQCFGYGIGTRRFRKVTPAAK